MRHTLTLGFTGTRQGLTPPQLNRLRALVAALGPTAARHGDCCGGDAAFHTAVRDLTSARVTVHPPLDPVLRVYRSGDEVLAPKPYLERNADIVAGSDLVLACPLEPTPQPRGGTWHTVNLCRTRRVPCVVVWPDGATSLA